MTPTTDLFGRLVAVLWWHRFGYGAILVGREQIRLFLSSFQGELHTPLHYPEERCLLVLPMRQWVPWFYDL